MIRVFLSLLFCLLFIPASFGQSGAVDLDVNNVRARFNSTGNLFWDMNSLPKYHVPKDAQNTFYKSPIFSASLCFHAIDSLGDTLMAVEMYRQNGADFGEGALPPGAQIGFVPIYGGKIARLNRDDIENGSQDSTQLVLDARTWPANYTFNGTTYSLAPFVDLNKNGIYEPTFGDYPYFQGDQGLFFTYHDMVGHDLTKTKPLGVQVIAEAHAWATNDKINDYIFLRYKIVSQNQNFKQFRVGVFSDYDLGNYSDDYVGTDTSRNMTYVMNGDDDDEGILGYGYNPPAFATVFLNQPLCGSCMGENKFSGIHRIPTEPQDFSNFLLDLDMDGDSLQVQASGFSANTHSRYSFTGDPTGTNQGWTMETDPRYLPGDYRMLGITGKDTMMKGDTFDLWLAFVYARGTSGGAKGSLDKLQTDVDDLFDRYFTKPEIRANCFSPAPKVDTTGQGTGFLSSFSEIHSTIYPNPATNDVHVQLSDPDASFSCEISNEIGLVLFRQEGVGKLALNCAQLPQGIYYLHLTATESGQSITHKLVIVRGR